MRGEHLFEPGIIHLVSEVPDIQLHTHLSLPEKEWRGPAPTERQRARIRGQSYEGRGKAERRLTRPQNRSRIPCAKPFYGAEDRTDSWQLPFAPTHVR